MKNCFRVASVAVVAITLFAGCEAALKEPAKEKKKPEPIIGRTTQDIGEFDAAADNTMSSSEGAVNIVTGAAGAYRPAIEKIAKIQITQAVNLFNAAEGRYPKDIDEFMSKVIKANNISLPKLPAKYEYQYDVANHELVVVEATE